MRAELHGELRAASGDSGQLAGAADLAAAAGGGGEERFGADCEDEVKEVKEVKEFKERED